MTFKKETNYEDLIDRLHKPEQPHSRIEWKDKFGDEINN